MDTVVVDTYSDKNRARKSTRLCTYKELLADGDNVEGDDVDSLGWDVQLLRTVAASRGLTAVRRHVEACLVYVVNGNRPLLVTKTWDGRHDNYTMTDATKAFRGMKAVSVEVAIDEEAVLRLEADLDAHELAVSRLEQQVAATDEMPLQRELKAARRRLDKAHAAWSEERERLEAGKTKTWSLHDLVQDTLPRITRNNLVFRPGGDVLPGDFNLFDGYAAERLLPQYPGRYPEAVQPILNHIKDVLYDGDEERYDFTLRWFAHILQNPKRKCGVALVFRSEKQGAGKGRLFEFLKRVIGSRYVLSVGDNNALTGQFNAHRANKLLILANELGCGGAAYKEANVLKSMITDEDDYIEPKGVDRQTIDSVSSIMMFTNEWKAIRVEPNDRRYCAQECSDAAAGDAAYFERLTAAIEDPKAQVEFFHRMREIDLGGFHFGTRIPQTVYRAELQREHRPAVYRFLADMVQTEWETRQSYQMSVAGFFDRLKDWMEANNDRGAAFLSNASVGRDVKKLGFVSKIVRVSGHSQRWYDFESRDAVIHALRAQGVDDNEA